MNIQIYVLKKNFDAQKAERWFKERRIPVQWMDLTRCPLGKRELDQIASQVGLPALIDQTGKPFLESPARFMTGREALLEALIENPKLLHLPIVRNGKQATIGYVPAIWETWK